MQNDTPSAVGIDVAKATLSVCVRYPDGGERALTLRNIETDIKEKLVPAVSGCTGKVVMESTGHYQWRAALLLADADMDVRVVNPILAKQYTAGNIRKVKTDPADAKGLARMAMVADNLPARFENSRENLRIRKKIATIATLKHNLQAMTASLASLAEAREILGSDASPAEAAILKAVTDLKRSVVQLEAEVVRDTGAHHGADLDRLVSIPGVSAMTASVALALFRERGSDNPKSWVAFAGLDVSSRSSGTWQGQCHLTKRGNGYLRARLFAAAWGAMMHDDETRAYYDRLRKEGRSYVESLVIIARKIVRTMFVMMRDKSNFDPEQFIPKIQSA
jgi:transposase